MKIAICFSGLPRFVKEGYELFSKNLIGFEDMDIFYHSWMNPAPGNNDKLVRQDTIEEVEQLYNITDSKYEDQQYVIPPELRNKKIKHREFVHWSMFYSIHACNNIKKQYENKHNMKYDIVIRSRFDCALLQAIDVTNPSFSDDSILIFPWVHEHAVMDWFAFSSSKIMDIYSDVWCSMIDYKKNGIKMHSGEELLTHHLNANNIKFTDIDKDVRLIRNSNDMNVPTWINNDKI